MKVCPETPADGAAAPCVEAPPRGHGRFLGAAAAVLVLGGLGWFARGYLSADDKPGVHLPPKVNVAIARRARAPIPLTTTGEIVRLPEAKSALVTVEVPAEQGRGFFKVGTAEIRPRALENRLFVGTVKTTGEREGKVFLEFEVDLSDAPSLTNGRADVTLVPPGEAPMIVPLTAVVTREGGRRIAVVENGVIRWKLVAIGRELGSQLEVLSGLEDGQKYIQRADPTLHEDTPVRVSLR